MTTTARPQSYTARAALLREQSAYRRRVAAFGLPALLAPYTLARVVRVPSQREASE